MTARDAVWCVEWLDRETSKTEFCATALGKKPSPLADIDRTRCGMVVTFRIGSTQRLPTCRACLLKMGLLKGAVR